jgi:uncharacterized protein with GYD domain
MGSSNRALAASTRIIATAAAPTASPAGGPPNLNAATIGTAIARTISGSVQGLSLTGSSLLTYGLFPLVRSVNEGRLKPRDRLAGGAHRAAHKEEDYMAVFIMLTKLTPNGVKTLKDNPGRVQEVNKEVEQLGVKVLNQWATLGEYDFVSVVEAPDEGTMAKVSVELGSRGTTSNETMAAIPAEDFTKSL